MSDILAAARDLQSEIRARAREIEEARRLPADLARKLARAGLLRMASPREIGGPEHDPETIFRAIELIGEADASAGWCVMIAVTSAMSAAYLPLDAAREVFGAPDSIAGGVFAPMGRAVADGSDFILDGRWQWASGSANCDWLGGGAIVMDDGQAARLPNGAPVQRMLFFPATSAELVDSWHVAGLCGTGSGEMIVRRLRVPQARSAAIATDRPTASGALYRFPVFGLLALGIAAVMLGNARAAVDELVDLAGGRRPQGSTRTLAERATAQAELAEATARLRAARAYFRESVAAAWEMAQNRGEIALGARVDLRLAATHAARTAAAVTRGMCDLGGGASVFLDSPLQRRHRDAIVGAQHMMVAAQTFELTGRHLMGVKGDSSFL